MNKLIRWLFILLILGAMSYGLWWVFSLSSDQRTSRNIEYENRPLVLVVKDRNDALSVDIANHLSQSFDYSKIPFQTFDLALFSEGFEIPESVRLLCITTTSIQNISDRNFDKLLHFLADGNNIFFTLPVFEPRFKFLQGIKLKTNYVRADSAFGYSFNTRIFPNAKIDTFKLPTPQYHKALDSGLLQDKVTPLINSSDQSNTPILYQNSIVGAGDVYIFNSLTAYDKINRGILFSTVLKLLEGIPYPVLNISTIFLDDFPAPLYDIKQPPINWEYDTTYADFVSKIWWPDMKALADRFDIDYTALTAFNYNAKVVPPFDFEEWRRGKITVDGERVPGSIRLARDVSESRHELGLHGYNHFSLRLKLWPNKEFMIASLQAARKRWRIDGLGDLPSTYVPPTNNIDSVGIEALSKAVPSVQYMSSLYLGDRSDGAGREFDPDPYEPGFFNYPRITSGFVPDENLAFHTHSLYLLTGLWTHFVHPDDVFQVVQNVGDDFTNRNVRELGWHKSRESDVGLYEEFVTMLRQHQSSYPQTRFLSVKEAAPMVMDWRNMFLKREWSGERQYVEKMYTSSHSEDRNHGHYWFMYVPKDRADRMQEELQSFSTDVNMIPFWEGYLAQFKTESGIISIPELKDSEPDTTGFEGLKANLRTYLNPPPEEGSTWRDTRLEEALAELERNPDSKDLQERVITLALEFNRLDHALSILEKRLLTEAGWNSRDMERLLTYYGYEEAYKRAFNFLEKMWKTYNSQTIITLKDKMVERFGAPASQFSERWLKRELQINPGDESILKKLASTNQSEENWLKKREYLLTLIEENPASDTLYHYTLQRSFYYDSPRETINLLEEFPDSAHEQLHTLAGQIAFAYGYELKEYRKALKWASRANNFPVQTRLEWLLQQNNHDAFLSEGKSYLKQHPDNDSLRVFIGQQLMYEGYYDESYKILYPLFKNGSAPENTRTLVYTEVGYKGYRELKQFYGTYPAFFSDSLKKDLKNKVRITEGARGGVTARYATDNFGNDIADFETIAEWGNINSQVHTATARETFIGTRVGNTNLHRDLLSFRYTYKRSYANQTMQSTMGGGLYFSDGDVKPGIRLGFWFANDSSFTSINSERKPVLTAPSLAQGINQIKSSLYREDFWSGGTYLTTLSTEAGWYSDRVFSYELLPRFYVQLPFSTDQWRYRAIAEFSYSDATTEYVNAVPYYTPDQLLVKGAGLDVRFRNHSVSPNLTIELEAIGKHDNRDGFFFASTARINATVNRYWKIGLNANISSSRVYRYNNVGFSFSYIFPKPINND